MSAFLKPLKRDLFSSPAPEQSHSQNEIPRNSSNISLIATENSASGSFTDSTRQSRRLTKANFDEALRYRTVGLSFFDNGDSINLLIDNQVPSYQNQCKWLVSSRSTRKTTRSSCPSVWWWLYDRATRSVALAGASSRKTGS
jgi:hypothetical protein